MNPEPSRCSVVIAWVNEFELLEPGLRALENQSVAPFEIVIATRHNQDARRRLSRAFPAIRIVDAGAGATVPRLRAAAIRATRGDVVLVTEDHCVPAADWIERGLAAISAGADIAGGPVENAWALRRRDKAAFLTEYSGVMRPEKPGVENVIPGNNVAYTRERSLEIAATLESDRWESFALAPLAGRGAQIRFDRDMIVHHRRPFGIRYFLSQRFHFCRSFAEMRRGQMSLGARMAWAGACALMPAALSSRCFRNLTVRNRLPADFALLSPLVFSYFCAGAAGEMMGYLFGGADSLRRVE